MLCVLRQTDGDNRGGRRGTGRPRGLRRPGSPRTGLRRPGRAARGRVRHGRDQRSPPTRSGPRGSAPPRPWPPPPGLANLDRLVERTAGAGGHGDGRGGIGEPRSLPASLDLSAFRIVQESLTKRGQALWRGPLPCRPGVQPGQLAHRGHRPPGPGVARRGWGACRGGPHRPGPVSPSRGNVPMVAGVQIGARVPAGAGVPRRTGAGGRPGAPPRPHGAAGPDRAGHGIIGMRERVSLCGGELHAMPRPGGGFVVRARLPPQRGAAMTLRVLVVDDQAPGPRGLPRHRRGHARIHRGRRGPATGARRLSRPRRASGPMSWLMGRSDAGHGRHRGHPPDQPGRRPTSQVRVLILTTFDLDEYVFAALRAGASGFPAQEHLPRRAAERDPGSSRRETPARPQRDAPPGRGVRPATPPLTPAAPGGRASALDVITARGGARCWGLVASGLSNTEIAQRLDITPGHHEDARGAPAHQARRAGSRAPGHTGLPGGPGHPRVGDHDQAGGQQVPGARA